MDRELIIQAKNEWDTFINSLTEDERKDLSGLQEAVDSNLLHYYSVEKNYSLFDLTFSNLSDEYKYSEELIETVFHCFMKREKYEYANNYINEAYFYYMENENKSLPVIDVIREKFPDKSILEKLKTLMGSLHAQKETDIPWILPDKLNDQNELKLFLLKELIEASKKLLNKIKAIQDIGQENKYNDLLVAILELRFALWGWDIDDQSRIGTSYEDDKGHGGKDSGSADFIIKSGGSNIGLWEGLILRNQDYTKKHINKIEGYIKYLDHYYMIVYVTKECNKSFEEACKEYKNHILNIVYSKSFEIKKDMGYLDITQEFKNVAAFNIGRTLHENDKEVYHIIIDLT